MGYCTDQKDRGARVAHDNDLLKCLSGRSSPQHRRQARRAARQAFWIARTSLSRATMLADVTERQTARVHSQDKPAVERRPGSPTPRLGLVGDRRRRRRCVRRRERARSDLERCRSQQEAALRLRASHPVDGHAPQCGRLSIWSGARLSNGLYPKSRELNAGAILSLVDGGRTNHNCNN
jgi:hypothetical protein